MSFLDRIQAQKEKLNPTETRVTTTSGSVSIQRKSEIILQCPNSAGFIVDPNPDLRVAKVLPNLFMGSQDPACDHELLVKYDVRHILSLGIETPKYEGIKYYVLPILDLPDFNIIPFLKNAFSIIDSVRNLNEIIYVHCNAGVSRSSSVIIGYLMKENLWTYKQAYDYLKEIRSCIKPNQGFIVQLMELERETTSKNDSN